MIRRILVLALLLLVPSASNATTINWVNEGGDGSWETGSEKTFYDVDMDAVKATVDTHHSEIEALEALHPGGGLTVANGGTGSTTASAARTALGLAIGTDVQAFDADLTDLADGTLTGSKVGSGIAAGNITTGTLALARGGTGATTASAARGNLGVAIGSQVQAFDADLTDLADGSLTGSKVGTGIAAGNITTGSLPDARLSSGVQIAVATGTQALGTSAISANSCATVITASASGVATTDIVEIGFNGDPTGVTGYGAGASDGLAIYAYPSTNNVNFKVCNMTGSSITPGALTVNYRVSN